MNSYRPIGSELFVAQYPARLGIARLCFGERFSSQNTDAGVFMRAFFLVVTNVH
jgi:hypothetical protein